MKVEIYTKNNQKFPKRTFPDFTQEYANRWAVKTDAASARKYVRKANRKGFYARCFEEKYERSGTYRSDFIRANRPKDGYYRCVYCGRKVQTRDMVVDHVVPVAAAKKSKKIQKKFSSKNGINDLKNLVPACKKCNKKKGYSTAWKWRWKSWIGKKTWYWRIRKIAIVCIMMIIMYCIGYIASGGSALNLAHEFSDIFFAVVHFG